MQVASFFSFDLSPDKSPGFLQNLLFKIEPLPITPIFLFKACVFVFLLVTASRLVQRVLVNRLFGHLHIADAQKFALGLYRPLLFR